MMLRATALLLVLAWGGVSPGAFAQDADPKVGQKAEQPVARPTAKTPAKTSAAKPAAKPTAKKKSAKKPVEVDPGPPVSQTVIDLAGWVIASGDNRELPFAVVDKDTAQLLVFGADGKLQGLAPALIGSAVGDESAPGVGDRELKDIPAEERTTPAGRYLAAYGPAAGGERVLWVDYATAVSIHPVSATAPKKERRKQRLASPTAEDNRITHGCINVTSAFYTKTVRPIFKKGGVFYILPDSMPVKTAFPGFVPPDRFADASEGAIALAAKPSR
jgi:hypothetical protein